MRAYYACILTTPTGVVQSRTCVKSHHVLAFGVPSVHLSFTWTSELGKCNMRQQSLQFTPSAGRPGTGHQPPELHCLPEYMSTAALTCWSASTPASMHVRRRRRMEWWVHMGPLRLQSTAARVAQCCRKTGSSPRPLLPTCHMLRQPRCHSCCW
jgi:hypothetical protein